MHSGCVCCFVCGGNFAYTTRFDPDRPHVDMLTGSMQPKAQTSCCMHVEKTTAKKSKLVSFLYEMQAQIYIYINMYKLLIIFYLLVIIIN